MELYTWGFLQNDHNLFCNTNAFPFYYADYCGGVFNGNFIKEMCMNYLLIDEHRKQNAINHIQKLDIGDKWEVVIQEYKKKRSVAQNRLYWKWVTIIADWQGQSKKATHQDLVVEFLGTEEVITTNGVKLIMPKSTTELNTKEMKNYLLDIEVMAAENEIVLPHPDDYHFAMMLDPDNLSRMDYDK